MNGRYPQVPTHPILGMTLARLHGTPTGTKLEARLLELADTPHSSPTGDAIRHALPGHYWLLERAVTGPIPLTAAGWLKPDHVKALAAVLPCMTDWIFPISRENTVHPVAGFRTHVQKVGLLRKYKGSLVLTKAGRTAHTDPQALWNQLVAHLIPTTPAFDQVAGCLVLLCSATSADDNTETHLIADAMHQLGWKHANGSRIAANDVQWVTNELWDALGNIGHATKQRRWDRTPSPDAIALVRDTLLGSRD